MKLKIKEISNYYIDIEDQDGDIYMVTLSNGKKYFRVEDFLPGLNTYWVSGPLMDDGDQWYIDTIEIVLAHDLNFITKKGEL